MREHIHVEDAAATHFVNSTPHAKYYLTPEDYTLEWIIKTLARKFHGRYLEKAFRPKEYPVLAAHTAWDVNTLNGAKCAEPLLVLPDRLGGKVYVIMVGFLDADTLERMAAKAAALYSMLAELKSAGLPLDPTKLRRVLGDRYREAVTQRYNQIYSIVMNSMRDIVKRWCENTHTRIIRLRRQKLGERSEKVDRAVKLKMLCR